MITDNRHIIKRRRGKKMRRKKYKEQILRNMKKESNKTCTNSSNVKYFRTATNKMHIILSGRKQNESLISQSNCSTTQNEAHDEIRRSTNYKCSNISENINRLMKDKQFSCKFDLSHWSVNKNISCSIRDTNFTTVANMDDISVTTHSFSDNKLCCKKNNTFGLLKNNTYNIMKSNPRPQNQSVNKKNMDKKKGSNVIHEELGDLDYCIHCNQFVGGESMSNITQHSVLCKKRNTKCLTCFKCNFTTRNIRHYERHCFHGHYSTSFTCSKCQHISNNIFTFVVHRRKHLNSRPYMCEICSKHFITLHTLLRHKDIHKVNKTDKQLQCRMCPKTFSLKHYRREHEMTHNKNKFKCNYCFHKTNRRMYLKKHIRMHETGHSFFNSERFCETCNIAFQTRHVFVIHVLQKHMQNYTVLVKKKPSSEIETPRKYRKNGTTSSILFSQLTRKKVKIKRYRHHKNQSSRIKIIKIIRRNATSASTSTHDNNQ